MNISKYTKFVVALAAALGVLGVSLADGTVTPSEWAQIALAFLGALGVYQFKNTPDKPAI